MMLPMKLRILFIDDDLMLLKSMARVLHPMRHEWEMEFVDSGAKALEIMAENPFDLVVSDMVMPGMSGAQLLNEVMERYPHTHRFILSGHASSEDIFKCVLSADRYFSKPMDIGAFKASVNELSGVHESLGKLVSDIKMKLKNGEMDHDALSARILRDALKK